MSAFRPKNFDKRPGFFLAHEYPDNMKIAPLSDAAFRLHVTAMSYCSRLRTDGLIPDAVWRAMGSPKARRELMSPPRVSPERAPLVHAVAGGVMLHDYVEHNRTSDEIDAASNTKGQAGALGAHNRWHVGRRRVDPECEHCKVADTSA